MKNSAAISIAALSAALTATRADALDSKPHQSGQQGPHTGSPGVSSYDTGAASLSESDAGTDGSVDVYEG